MRALDSCYGGTDILCTFVFHFTIQRHQLIRLGVPTLFIAVALDEGPGPPLRSPYTDLTKLYGVVSILVRCCDVTSQQKSLMQVSLMHDDAPEDMSHNPYVLTPPSLPPYKPLASQPPPIIW